MHPPRQDPPLSGIILFTSAAAGLGAALGYLLGHPWGGPDLSTALHTGVGVGGSLLLCWGLPVLLYRAARRSRPPR